MIACLERFMVDADERGNTFVQGVLDKQHTRLKARFDRHVVSLVLDRCNLRSSGAHDS